MHALILLFLFVRRYLVVPKRSSEIKPDISAGFESFFNRACNSIEVELEADVSTHSGPRVIAGLHHGKARLAPVIGGLAQAVEQALEA